MRPSTEWRRSTAAYERTAGGARAAARLTAALVAGLLVTATAACGAPGGSPAATATPTPSATAESSRPTGLASQSTNAPNVHVVEIRISGGKVSPPPGRVAIAKGETVRLVVHSDTADEVHLHGYDREARLAPGTDAIIEFVADQTGLFEVETHESGLVLTQLIVR